MKALKIHRLNATRRTSQGFTLLEVMLAFVVFALSFATVLEIMAGSMRSVRRASEDTEAALFAQSLVERVGTEIPLEDSEFSGVGLDRYEWRLAIYLYASSETDARTLEIAEMSGIELYKVDLDLDWATGQRQRELHFSTIRGILANRK